MAAANGDRHVALRGSAGHLDDVGYQRRAPLEMAQAYSVIAADGVLHHAQFVNKIVGPRRQGALREHSTPGTRVLTPEVARTETQMLTEVLKSGTAAGLSIGRPGRGQDRHDRQERRRLVRRVHAAAHRRRCGWATRSARHSMSNVGGISVFGATYPADIWKAYHGGRAREPAGRRLHAARRDLVAGAAAHRRVRPQQELLPLLLVGHDPDDDLDA